MSKAIRGRFSIPWYILVDREIDEYTRYLMTLTGEARNAIVRRAVTVNRYVPSAMTFAEWKKQQKKGKK